MILMTRNGFYNNKKIFKQKMVICHIAVCKIVSCVLYLAAIMTRDQYMFQHATFTWDVCLQTFFNRRF